MYLNIKNSIGETKRKVITVILRWTKHENKKLKPFIKNEIHGLNMEK